MTFDVVMADCPWSFDMKKTGGSFKSGAEQKYPTMELAAIQQIPVAAVAAPNSALFLWVPSRLKFSHGLTTALAWGFEHYEATIYWDKERLGMGYWFRGQVEELLVFTRGDVAPFRCQRPNLVRCPSEKHSEKPEEFRRIVESATQKFERRRCIELFARRKAPRWVSVGHAVTERDIRTDIRLLAEDETRP